MKYTILLAAAIAMAAHSVNTAPTQKDCDKKPPAPSSCTKPTAPTCTNKPDDKKPDCGKPGAPPCKPDEKKPDCGKPGAPPCKSECGKPGKPPCKKCRNGGKCDNKKDGKDGKGGYGNSTENANGTLSAMESGAAGATGPSTLVFEVLVASLCAWVFA